MASENYRRKELGPQDVERLGRDFIDGVMKRLIQIDNSGEAKLLINLRILAEGVDGHRLDPQRRDEIDRVGFLEWTSPPIFKIIPPADEVIRAALVVNLEYPFLTQVKAPYKGYKISEYASRGL